MRSKRLIRDFIPSCLLRVIKSLCYKLRGAIFSGNKYYCPVCEKGLSRFLTYENANTKMCPNCASLSRHRSVFLYLKTKKYLSKKNTKMLHFAPEYSLQKKFKSIFGKNYISTDIEHPDAMLHADITNMPLKKNSFDIIICNHVLQEIREDVKAIGEMFRLLKRSGVAIITIPINKRLNKTIEKEVNTDKERAELYGYYGAIRIYGREFIDRLKKAGFETMIIHPLKFFSKEEIKKHNLGKEKIYVCKK